MVGDVIRDFKYAIRSFVRRPLFTAVIVLTLALGIGSNVAMFSVANAVLLRALPYDHPEELALVWTRLQATNVERSLVSGPDLKDYEPLTTRFEGFAGAAAVPGTLTGAGPAERIVNGYTTWNLFELLGVRPLLGRTFRKDDAITIDPKQFANPNPDLPPGTVMLSYGLWQRRFGGDPDVIGRTIQLDGWGSVVVGVLPPAFRIYLPADAAMPTNVDAWGVLPVNMSDFARDAAWLTVVTRLRDGVTLEQAQQEMDAVIDTTPVWLPDLEALKRLKPGGRLVINAIRKQDSDQHLLSTLDYSSQLWMEKEIKSTANVTRQDVREFLELAARGGIHPDYEEFDLELANLALVELKQGKIRGAKVLLIGESS